MTRRCLLILLAPALLAGCAGFAIPSAAPQPPVIGKVIIDLPPGPREAATLAIRHANAARDAASVDYLNGIQLQPVYMDDTLDGLRSPGMATVRLTDLLTGPHQLDYLGIVGPADDQLALREMSVASEAQVAMISPTLTLPCLTVQQPYCPPGLLPTLYPKGSLRGKRGQDFFFRLATSRSAEGAGAADWAANSLQAHAAFVIDGGTAEAKSTAEDFGLRLQSDGGAVAGKLSLTPGGPPSGLRQEVLSQQPDLIFFAGATAAQAGQIRAALGQLPAGVSFLSTVSAGDELGSSDFASAAGQFAEGSYVVALEPDAEHAAQGFGLAHDFYAAFKSAHPAETPDGWDLNAYLATEMLIRAISAASATATGQAVALPQARDVLQVLSPATASSSSSLVTMSSMQIDAGDNYGAVAFDNNGDTLNQILTFYQLTGGAWKFVAQTSPVTTMAPSPAPQEG